MQRVQYNRYGNADVLELVERPVPVPSAHQVLVEVKAVALNPLDWKLFEGQMKLVTGSKFPRNVGIEFSGIVGAVPGPNAKLKKGDAVFGAVDAFTGGALAEQILVLEKDVSLKPPALSFAQAAALPIGGISALQILEDLAPLREGMEVLVNGATGGVGAFVTQIAKRRGAIVTAAVSTRGTQLAETWGADVVIDYRKQSVLALGHRFDLVVDLSDKLPFAAARAVMKPTSIYVNAMPNPKDMLVGFFHNIVSKQKQKILVMKYRQDRLDTVAQYASDWMDVVIGSTFPLASFRQAYLEARTAGTLGKSVITIP